jgi:hypothetical protein
MRRSGHAVGPAGLVVRDTSSSGLAARVAIGSKASPAELTETGELPCLRFGRRNVIPRRAIDLIIERALDYFDPDVVVRRLVATNDDHAVVDANLAPAAPAYAMDRERATAAPGTRGSRRSSHSQQMDLL